MKRARGKGIEGKISKKPRALTLGEAAALGDVESVKRLLENSVIGLPELNSALHQATKKRWLIIDTLFKEHKGYVHWYNTRRCFVSELRKELKTYDEIDGHNYIEVVKLLLAKGANVNAFQGDTPLHTACNSNDLLMVELLLKSGADCTIRDNDLGDLPITAIDGLKISEHIEDEVDNGRNIVISLLKHGADLNSEPSIKIFGITQFLDRINFETPALPGSLSNIFPSTKYVLHAKFQIYNAIKDLDIFACVSKKSSEQLHSIFPKEFPLLPEDLQFLIMSYCSTRASIKIISSIAPIKVDAPTIEERVEKTYERLLAYDNSKTR